MLAQRQHIQPDVGRFDEFITVTAVLLFVTDCIVMGNGDQNRPDLGVIGEYFWNL